MVSKLISLIKQIGAKKYNEIVDDPRPEVEKQKDYKYGQDMYLPSGSLGQRVTKLPWVPYDQDASSACGAFSASHARRLEENNTTYPLQWYRSRSNYSGKGMYLKDVLKLAAHADLVKLPKKTKGYTEEQANALALLDLFNNDRKEKFEYIQIDPYQVNDVWDAVSNGHACILSFYSTYNEWVEEMTVKDYTTPSIAAVRHFVVALPNSVHEKDGQQWVSVVDSSPAHGFALRHISKDFLANRMYHGAGFYHKVTTKKTKVRNVPTKHVRYGMSNADVRLLQVFLNQEGLLSSTHITGYYGNITAGAVLNWQMIHIGGLDIMDLQGKYWGPRSINKAKELYPNV